MYFRTFEITLFSNFRALCQDEIEDIDSTVSTKTPFCNFKNDKKSIFAPEKSLKLPKMQFLD